MTELKPCPFCHGEREPTVNGGACFVVCHGCGCEGPSEPTELAAIAAWNTRASPWRPIEGAPRDGTRVLLWYPKYGPSTGHWHELIDGSGKWDGHSLLNKDAEPTKFMFIQPPESEKRIAKVATQIVPAKDWGRTLWPSFRRAVLAGAGSEAGRDKKET